MTTKWELHLNIDKSNDSKPIYLLIVQEIISKIKTGLLKPNEALPGSRKLAQQLGVNKNTVVQALDILISEGWLSSQERKRAVVSSIRPITSSTSSQTSLSLNIKKNYSIFFDDGTPNLDNAPLQDISCSYRRIFNKMQNFLKIKDDDNIGLPQFREAISRMLAHNRQLRASADEICICRGAQMAVFLLANTILKAGDVVLVEAPGYKLIWDVFTHAGAEIIPIKIDKDGIIVDEIERLLQSRKIKALYITPCHQYPTTVSLSIKRRFKIIELSNKYEFTVIENDFDSEFHFAGNPIIPLCAQGTLKNFAYVGTFSKLITPTIRIGYIYSSSTLINAIGEFRKIIDRQGDNIMEYAILDLINSGKLLKYHKRMLKFYKKRRNFVYSLLDKYLSDIVDYDKPMGGLAVWLRFRKGFKVDDIRIKANNKLLDFYDSSRYSFDESINGLRLGYASLSEEALEKGIKILADCCKK